MPSWASARQDRCPFDHRLDAKDAYVWSNKGRALLDLQRYSEALPVCERALKLDPKYAMAWNNKANTLERMGRTAEAQQARQKARELGYTE